MSAAFTFRLGSVLRHRRRTEDARAQALRQAMEADHTARAQHAALVRAAAAARVALAADVAGGLTGASLRIRANVVRDILHRARKAAELAETAAAHVHARRSELVDAARARRAIERLEEMQRADWRAGREHVEQRSHDEVAATRRGENA